MSTHPDPTARPVPTTLTRLLVAPHALLGLLAVGGAVLLALGSATDTSGDPMAGVGVLFAAGLAVVGLPLLVLAAVSLLSHRPGRVHGAAVAVVAWVVLVLVVTFVGGPGFWLVGIWVLFVPAHPLLAVPSVALLASAAAGLLALRRTARAG